MADDMQAYNFTRDELLCFCRAVANVIASDRKISDEERAHLAGVIQETGLSIADPDVQKAVYSELSNPKPIEQVVKMITSPILRKNLYRTLIEVALSDGLAPQEDEKLAKIAEQFQLNPKAARELIQWTLESIALEKREDDILRRL
jgi:uncharacterized membrane protein YebE (DUF533 family)